MPKPRHLLAPLTLVITAGAIAQQPAAAPSEVVSEFIACEALSIGRERLACFDAALKQYKLRSGLSAGTVQDAQRQRQIYGSESGPNQAAVVAPRVEAEILDQPAQNEPQNRFGLPPEPREEGPVQRLVATVVQVDKNRLGHTFMKLSDGSIWTDDADGRRVRRVEVGDSVEIYEGSFGGFRLEIGGGSGVADVRRVR